MSKLKYFKTYELVNELKRRREVEARLAEPYEVLELNVNGPAIVLIVTD